MHECIKLLLSKEAANVQDAGVMWCPAVLTNMNSRAQWEGSWMDAKFPARHARELVRTHEKIETPCFTSRQGRVNATQVGLNTLTKR